MTTSYGMAVGRRPGPAAVLAMALSLGACEALSGQEASVPKQASAVSADTGDSRLADRRGLHQAPAGVDEADDSQGALGGASDDDSAPSVGGEAGKLPSRIMVVRAPGGQLGVECRTPGTVEKGDRVGG